MQLPVGVPTVPGVVVVGVTPVGPQPDLLWSVERSQHLHANEGSAVNAVRALAAGGIDFDFDLHSIGDHEATERVKTARRPRRRTRQ